ncbi:MAG: putative baseplate assembly protein [Candidatus Promineifilaceae bacterium]|nr:putative baseplate assembly protein [Candidatus Promineifilaceae bacterium]
MPLTAPELDTRSFEEIYNDLRLRVPQYTPEWTDFNESDPGVALLQLFAWLAESLNYRMNQVPERNYIKFLQLLNMELRPAQPAIAHLTFTPRPGADVVGVPQGAKVSAQPADGGTPLVYETETGLSIIRPALTDILAFDGTAFRNVTTANQTAATSFRPFGWSPQIGSALYLGFAADPPQSPPVLPQQVSCRAPLPASAQAGVAQKCAEVQRPPIPPVRLEWQYKPNQTARWRRLNEQEDTSVALTREGYILVEGPREIEPTAVGQGESRYWLRCRLQSGGFAANAIPEIDFIRPNTVEAVNLTTVRQEIIGISEGHPNQSFTTRYKPVQASSLRLAVEVADQEPPLSEWEQQSDFLHSGRDDPHFVLNATKGEVKLGGERLDGRRQHGRIPPAGANIIALSYRYGGGERGNVASNLITTLLTSLTGIDSVTNERPATGGRDEQPAKELMNQAPAVIRSRNRAVTAEDFAALAGESGGIKRATAIPLAHRDHPLDVQVPGAITVVVVPDNGAMPPEPTSDEIRSVCRYLEQFRLVTTELYVKGPQYTEVQVNAHVEAYPYASPDIVSRDVKIALNSYLDPLSWAFGGELYPTSLYGIIQEVQGVAAVPILEILVGKKPHEDLSRPVVLGLDGLLYGTSDHEIVVVPQRDL